MIRPPPQDWEGTGPACGWPSADLHDEERGGNGLLQREEDVRRLQDTRAAPSEAKNTAMLAMSSARTNVRIDVPDA